MTDEPFRAFSIETGQQCRERMLLASNLRQRGRGYLWVTVGPRIGRTLSAEDHQEDCALFAPYLAEQYVYRLKKEDLPLPLPRIGEERRRLLKELGARSSNGPV